MGRGLQSWSWMRMRIRISGRRKIGLREFFPWPLLVFTGVYWCLLGDDGGGDIRVQRWLTE